MLLERLRGRNWCQHARIDVTFHPGMNAILGQNGSGKSNLLGLISWLLTGENPNAGVKGDNIYQKAPVTERAGGELTFVHLGHRYVLERHLRPARERATLTKDGIQIALGDENVTAAAMAEVAMDPKFIPRFVIVPQADIHAFLDARASEVDKFFQRLFDTGAAAVALKQLNEYMAGIDMTPVLGLDDAEAAVAANQARQAAIVAELSQLRTAIESDTSTDAQDHAIVNAVAWLTQVQTLLATATAEQQTAATLATQKRRELDEQLDNQRVLQLAMQKEQPQCDAARAALTSFASYKALVAQRTQVATFLAQYAADQASRSLPTIPPNYIPEDDRLTNTAMRLQAEDLGKDDHAIVGYSPEILQRERGKPIVPPVPPAVVLTQEQCVALSLEVRRGWERLDEDNKFIQTFQAGGVANCPTCRTPTTALADVVTALAAGIDARVQQLNSQDRELNAALEYLRNKTTFDRWYESHTANLARLEQQRVIAEALPAKRAAHTAMAIALADSASYDLQVANYRQWQASHNARVAELQQQQAALQGPQTPPPGDESALQQIVANQDAYREALSGLEPVITQLQTDVNRLDVDAAAKLQRCQDLQRQAADVPYTAADAAAAQQRLQQRTNFVTAITNLDREMSGLSAALPMLLAARDQKRDQVSGSRLRANWYTRLSTYQALLAASPRFVAQHNLRLLEAGTNEILDILQTGFHVTADSGLSFTAAFRDAVTSPASRLSGGQKVALALAFRVAVNSMFAGMVGLLALDEPTASLDKTRVRALQPVLSRLRELTAARGLQCIIVTHEDDLAAIFDNQIRL